MHRHNRLVQVAASRCCMLAAIGTLLWWRGPDWNVVYHAFDLVNWAWIVFALGLNLASVLVRSLAWRLTIDQALEPPHPPFNHVFSAFAVGLLGNAALPGPDRRARPRRRAAPAPSRTARARPRPSSAPSSRTGCSTSSRPCCWSSTSSKPRRSRPGRGRASPVVCVLGIVLFVARRRQRAARRPDRARGREAAEAAARDGAPGAVGIALAASTPPRRSCSSASAGGCSCSPSTSRCGRSTSTHRFPPRGSSCC